MHKPPNDLIAARAQALGLTKSGLRNRVNMFGMDWFQAFIKPAVSKNARTEARKRAAKLWNKKFNIRDNIGSEKTLPPYPQRTQEQKDKYG